MVAESLQCNKPSPEFTALIQKAIRLQREGSREEAYETHRGAWNLARELQEQGRYEEAVRAHQEGLEAVEGSDLWLDSWGSAYESFAESYHGAGKTMELAEGILRAMPGDSGTVPADESVLSFFRWPR